MSNQITYLKNQVNAMSSTEIAQLTGKLKKIIHRDIREQLLFGLYGLKDGTDLYHQQIQGITVVLDDRGYWSDVLLDREHTLTLITGYDVKARHKINKRWLELEASKPALPESYIEALQSLIESEKEKQKALDKIKADAPKIEFAMAVRNLDGSCLIGEFAKVIGTGQNKLFKRLREEKYLMINNKPYQKYIDAGWFVLIENTPFTDSKGKSHPTFTTRITGKGQVALEKKLRPAQNVELAVFQEAYHA